MLVPLWFLAGFFLVSYADSNLTSSVIPEDNPLICANDIVECYGECDGGDCVCPNGLVGNPYFGCFKRKYIFSDVLKDPGIATYGGEFARISGPGRFLYLQVVTRGPRGKICQIRVFAFLWYFNGKNYVRGFEFYIFCRTRNWSFFLCVRVRSRISGARPNEFTVDHRLVPGTSTPFINGSPNTTMPDNSPVCPIVVPNVVFVLDLPGCGVSIVYKSFNPLRAYVPGLCVTFLRSFQPTWQNLDETIALPPNLKLANISGVAAELGTTRENALWLRTILTGTQNSDVEIPALDDVQQILLNCSEGLRDQSLELGKFIYFASNFAKCYIGSGSPEPLVELFKDVVEFNCNRNGTDCDIVQDELRKGNCSQHVDQALLNFNCSILNI